MLTEAEIRAAKPREKAYKLFDGDGKGLFLLVTPTGGKLWRFKYRFGGKEKLLSLGIYPDISLKLARERRDEARQTLHGAPAQKGTPAKLPADPSALRRAAKLENESTFRAVADEWLELQAKTLAEETVSIQRARLEQVLFPAFGSRPIASIEPPDLLAVLKRIESRGNSETAHRLRALAGRVFRFAIATGRARHDISADLRGALAPVQTTNFPAITEPRRVGELLRAIDGYVGQPSTAYALKLAPYVFVRPGELRGAAWSEFNLQALEPEWRIPAERMKMGRPHIVPLASQVLTLLLELQGLTGDGQLLFPGLRTAHRPISENSLNAALRRLGFTQAEHTTHGFRTTASTNLNEQGWHPDLIELQLAHVEGNAVRAAYNKAQRLPERRKMMQAWADYLDGLRAGGKIIPLRSASA